MSPRSSHYAPLPAQDVHGDALRTSIHPQHKPLPVLVGSTCLGRSFACDMNPWGWVVRRSRPALGMDHQRRDVHESRDLRGLLLRARNRIIQLSPLHKRARTAKLMWSRSGTRRGLDSSVEKVSDHVNRITTRSKSHGFFSSKEKSLLVYPALNDLGLTPSQVAGAGCSLSESSCLSDTPTPLGQVT